MKIYADLYLLGILMCAEKKNAKVGKTKEEGGGESGNNFRLVPSKWPYSFWLLTEEVR